MKQIRRWRDGGVTLLLEDLHRHLDGLAGLEAWTLSAVLCLKQLLPAQLRLQGQVVGMEMERLAWPIPTYPFSSFLPGCGSVQIRVGKRFPQVGQGLCRAVIWMTICPLRQ